MDTIEKVVLSIQSQRKQNVQVVLLDDGKYAIAVDNVVLEVVRWDQTLLSQAKKTAYAMAGKPMPQEEDPPLTPPVPH